MGVFTGDIDPSILPLWNKINLALLLHCLPSEIDNESSRDMEALKVILSARKEYDERNKGG